MTPWTGKARSAGLIASLMLVALLAACSSDSSDSTEADASTPTAGTTPVATQVAAATAEADASLTPATPTPIPPTPTSSATRVPPTPTPTAPPVSSATPTSAPPTPTLTPLPTLDVSQLATPTPEPTPTPPPITSELNSGPLSQTKIVFARGTSGSTGAELRTISPDGSDGAVLRGFEYPIHNPKWSPDGNLLVVFEANQTDLITFVMMDDDGVVISTQHDWACVACVQHALWPRDTEGTVYVTKDGGLLEYVLTTGSVLGGVETFDQLPRPGEIFGIDLINAAATYALSTDMDGNWELYTGMGRVRLTITDDEDETTPRWSPDGTTLAYTTNRNGNLDIYLKNVESGVLRQITRSGADDQEPTWSPDGKFIAFSSNRDGNYAIYIASAEGLGEDDFLFRVTSSAGDDRAPDWRGFQ